MTDKVQKIREVIEKKYEYWKEKESNSHSIESEIRMSECQHLLLMLDSMQEEPVSSIWHNMDEVPIKGKVIVVQTKDTFYGLSIQKGGTTYKNKNKDRYVRWAYASDLLNLSNVQRTVKDLKEHVSVWHDTNHQPTMYRKYLVRYSDGRVSGSWERHDDGFIPWKDVVKEHGFTHWCYTEDLLKL